MKNLLKLNFGKVDTERFVWQNQRPVNAHQFEGGTAEWGTAEQNRLATELSADTKAKLDQLSSQSGTPEERANILEKIQKEGVIVARGDTMGAIAKGLVGKIDYSMPVEYRGNSALILNAASRNPQNVLRKANLIYPGQRVWFDSSRNTLVIEDSAGGGVVMGGGSTGTRTEGGASRDNVNKNSGGKKGNEGTGTGTEQETDYDVQDESENPVSPEKVVIGSDGKPRKNIDKGGKTAAQVMTNADVAAFFGGYGTPEQRYETNISRYKELQISTEMTHEQFKALYADRKSVYNTLKKIATGRLLEAGAVGWTEASIKQLLNSDTRFQRQCAKNGVDAGIMAEQIGKHINEEYAENVKRYKPVFNDIALLAKQEKSEGGGKGNFFQPMQYLAQDIETMVLGATVTMAVAAAMGNPITWAAALGAAIASLVITDIKTPFVKQLVSLPNTDGILEIIKQKVAEGKGSDVVKQIMAETELKYTEQARNSILKLDEANATTTNFMKNAEVFQYDPMGPVPKGYQSKLDTRTENLEATEAEIEAILDKILAEMGDRKDVAQKKAYILKQAAHYGLFRGSRARRGIKTFESAATSSAFEKAEALRKIIVEIINEYNHDYQSMRKQMRMDGLMYGDKFELLFNGLSNELLHTDEIFLDTYTDERNGDGKRYRAAVYAKLKPSVLRITDMDEQTKAFNNLDNWTLMQVSNDGTNGRDLLPTDPRYKKYKEMLVPRLNQLAGIKEFHRMSSIYAEKAHGKQKLENKQRVMVQEYGETELYNDYEVAVAGFLDSFEEVGPANATEIQRQRNFRRFELSPFAQINWGKTTLANIRNYYMLNNTRGQRNALKKLIEDPNFRGIMKELSLLFAAMPKPNFDAKKFISERNVHMYADMTAHKIQRFALTVGMVEAIYKSFKKVPKTETVDETRTRTDYITRTGTETKTLYADAAAKAERAAAETAFSKSVPMWNQLTSSEKTELINQALGPFRESWTVNVPITWTEAVVVKYIEQVERALPPELVAKMTRDKWDEVLRLVGSQIFTSSATMWANRKGSGGNK